mgnify:CR=1 FL=1
MTERPNVETAVAAADDAETAPRKRKVFVRTYGCQMNVYDSERMVEALGGQGYVETKTPDDADMILLNTCHIREKATEKVTENANEKPRCARRMSHRED